MTVNTTTITSGPYTATGGQTIFDYTFRADVEADLDVYVNEILRVDYTVSGLGDDDGGQIQFITGLTAGDKVYIRSSREATQDTEFSSQGGFYPEEHERAFDKLTYLIQQLGDKIKRTLRIADTKSEVAILDLVAGKFVQVNATGDGFQMADRPVEEVLNDAVVNTVADLAFTVGVPGAVYNLKEYHAGTGVGGGWLLAYAGSDTTDNGLIFASGTPGILFKRINYSIVDRVFFGSDAAFNAAKIGKVSIDANKNIESKIVPTGETQANLTDALNTPPISGRDIIEYWDATSVKVFRNFAVMNGFRFRGQYTKAKSPFFAMPASKIASTSTNLAGMSAVTTENWYAVFACADSGDSTAVLKITPFLRAGVVSGSNIPLAKGGEGVTSTVTQSYSWTAANNYTDTDILVISEAGRYSGRVTQITANSASQITVATIGSIAEKDYLLPAPVGYDHYLYLGCFYYDTGEVRNIYDTGTVVKSKGIYLLSPSSPSGSIGPAPGNQYFCNGYISPLATAAIIESSLTLSTASIGDYAEYFDGDGAGHVYRTNYLVKTSTASQTVVFSDVSCPFFYYQSFNFYNAGSLVASRTSGQLNVVGWIEP